MGRAPATALMLAACLLSPVVAQTVADPEGARQQYRVARRLVAEGSSEAAKALQRVIELDPKGELADDALVEQALLEGIPRWPEELGRIDATAAGWGRDLLARAMREFPRGDRSGEARLLHALLRLEPLAGRDPAGARLDLLTVANLGRSDPRSSVARYVAGWLDEQEGRVERARAAYQRLLIDSWGTPAASRAMVGLARLDLREGRSGNAAARLQEAIEAGVSDRTAVVLRELAVRSVLRGTGSGGGWGAPGNLGASTGIRATSGIGRLPDGGIVVTDRRDERVVHLDAGGAKLAEWPIEDPQAISVDGMGRVFVAAGEAIHRLGAERPVAVAPLGDFAPVSGMTSDSAGRIWVADRKGTRIGRLDPGAKALTPVWTGSSTRVSLLIWDGRRLVAIDARSGTLIEIDGEGTEKVVSQLSGLQKPVSIAVDPAGRIAVLDARPGTVSLFDTQGAVVDRFSCETHGLTRPAAIALGRDGSLDLLDVGSGFVRRVP